MSHDIPKRTRRRKKKTSKLVPIMSVAIILLVTLIVVMLVRLPSKKQEVKTDEPVVLSREEIQSMLISEETTEPEMYVEETTEPVPTETEPPQIMPFFEAKLAENPDIAGWVKIDGTKLDYPMMYTPDEEDKYLHIDFDGKWSVGGLPYIEENCSLEPESDNLIIYGHNMGQRVDHAMFGSLNWYYYKTGYYKEHTTFDIWIENTRYRYYVYAVFKTDAAGSDTFTYAFESDEAFMEYVNKCKSQSKYQFKEAPEITKDSMIITLVTCTHEEEKRLIVQLVRGEELDVNGNPVGAE